MSDNAFEKAVRDKLAAMPGVFMHHPPDDRVARNWKPGDFIFGHQSHWGVIEAKEVTGPSFPISRWSANQRLAAETVTAAGGTYWLLVRYQPSRLVSAFHGTFLRGVPAHAGLRPEQGRLMNVAGQGFDISLLVVVRPVGPH